MLQASHTANAFLPSVKWKMVNPVGMHTLSFDPSRRQLICQFNNSYASNKAVAGQFWQIIFMIMIHFDCRTALTNCETESQKIWPVTGTLCSTPTAGVSP